MRAFEGLFSAPVGVKKFFFPFQIFKFLLWSSRCAKSTGVSTHRPLASCCPGLTQPSCVLRPLGQVMLTRCRVVCVCRCVSPALISEETHHYLNLCSVEASFSHSLNALAVHEGSFRLDARGRRAADLSADMTSRLTAPPPRCCPLFLCPCSLHFALTSPPLVFFVRSVE